MRMGNVSGIDGPLNPDWHAGQLALQHKILDRMRALGMKPICPGFPGFIPEAFRRIYPDLHIVETHWGGAFHNWMISPTEPLFAKISEAFIKEWEKEFGKCDYYLVDSFNEMDIPFPEKGNPARYEMAASYGEKVYSSIKRANKDAVWVMQGWMFGYQRHIWDYETLGALVSRVPDDKMLLLDLAVDYNKHFWHSEVNWEYYKGFYNKQWVYSVIPNMGGKTGMTGVLDFYANGHLEVLSSSNRGNLVAHGLAPEGIENNEVLYELVTDAGWSDHRMDVRDWLKQYSINRYGKAPAQLMKAWDYLLKSVYGTFTDHPRFNWQFRPGTVKNGSIYMNEDYFRGLEAFLSASGELKDSPYYLTDLCEMTAHYLGGKAEILTRQIDQEYLLGDTLQAHFLQSRFETFMLGMDRILSQHPILRLDRWVSFASKAARTEAQRKQYEMNARRIVTVWGPPVDDYSARMWSGLIGQYYLGRWKEYYRDREKGEAVDLDDGSSFYRIYCNLLLNGGLKMREGYDRVATNNIILNNSLHPHVWVRNSDDVFKHNIVFTAYQPAVMNSALGESDRWGKELDYNLFATGQAAMRKFAAHGADAHSVSADPLFVNPGQGDFRVRPESPAFKIGFRNFDMTDFGVKSEKLKKLARTPDIPEIVLQIQDEVSAEYTWLGAVLKEVKGEELSAYGAKFSQASMALDRVPAESEAYKLGLRSGDLLLSLGGKEISTAASFKQLLEEYAGKSGELLVMRNQKEMVVKLAAFRGEMQPVER